MVLIIFSRDFSEVVVSLNEDDGMMGVVLSHPPRNLFAMIYILLTIVGCMGTMHIFIPHTGMP